MAWTTPGTATAGEVLTAAFWNTNVRDNSVELAPFFDAWTTWTTSLTGITTGNGTVTAKYLQIGKMIHFRFKFLLGSTSGITGTPQISLPVAPAAGSHLTVPVIYDDAFSALYPGLSQILSSTLFLYAINASTTYGANALITATVPFTWTTNDSIIANGTYEAA